ncbi:MAG: 3-hydroxyacyl-CoA dehydrogenase NAD-binding domain-containing protein, partial [Pseudomonadota bacterium]|nr:3-hydroxyacyl-CoA dehydrogenase NAD-binding domain-containing protein [Pseudomonadota bacterium]
RIALDDPKVQIGLPEVKLGIIPGWGGTVRLTQLIGPIDAMKIILQGRSVDARTAKKMGMIDEIARTEHLLHRAAVYYVLTKPEKHEPKWWQSLAQLSFIRPLLANKLRKTVSEKATPEHYPAPYAVIDNWQRDGAEGPEAMQNETKTIADLFFHPTSRELIRVFFLQSKLKDLGKKTSRDFQRVHVIGAGTMGGDIAAWCALCGMTVTLQDREAKYIAPAIKRAYTLFSKKLKQPRLVQAAMDRLIPDVDGDGVRRADVVIEAIYENLEAKQALYKIIEPQLKPDAILATNTSSLPLEELATVLANPNRLVGIHFFNPVAQMQLVEVVRSLNMDEKVYDTALAFVTKIKRLPLPVKSSPGFLINRILMPYLLEAVKLYEEGVPPMMIDKAAVDFGMPMGPIELADTVGLDICLSVAEILGEHYPVYISEKLRALVASGNVGRKSGSGFYQYSDGKPVKVSLYQEGAVPDDLTDRLILSMVNESVRCLDEGVVSEEDYVDAGLIYGTGFAPFRGGPMAYCHSEGAEELLSRLKHLAKTHGQRFKPADGWSKLAKSKAKKGVAIDA